MVDRLLVANRGEIAIRVHRAAAGLGIETVAIYPDDDRDSLHVRVADSAVLIPGTGPAAYLDIPSIVAVALEAGCDAVHPGYGFLSEQSAFARAVEAAGLTWVGPRPDVLDLFGDKARARDLAERSGVPVMPGTKAATSLIEARAFLRDLGGAPMMVKALAGGGGKGMRVVSEESELDDAFERCASEARSAFGDGDLYVERFMPRARHIEVQLVGDSTGAVGWVGTRECSLQRRHQKLIEIAPATGLSPKLESALVDAALRLGSAAGVTSLSTVEFLVDSDPSGADPFAFIEANARLQVEHTVTEEVYGVDLVQAQLRIAAGATLADLGLAAGPAGSPAALGIAVQARVNTESMLADGSTRPEGGRLAAFDLPAGPGVRVDTFGYTGYLTSPRYDSLLAKVVVHERTPGLALAFAAASRAVGELRTTGVRTNAPFLRALLTDPTVSAGGSYTTYVDDNVAALVARSAEYVVEEVAASEVAAHAPRVVVEGAESVDAPMLGTVSQLLVADGDIVQAGAQLAILEAMKMEHVILAPYAARVVTLAVSVGETVESDQPLIFLSAVDAMDDALATAEEVDLDHIRPDLAEVIARHEIGLDAARADAVAKRHKLGLRTARENIADLVDEGSWVEYAPLVIAAQRKRRTLEDLIVNTPADGLVTGVATVNADLFDEDTSRCMIMSYDYTVLAGTQGVQNHRKTDRMFELAERQRLPLVVFGEGGGGRPGDTDWFTGLDNFTWFKLAQLSGLVPLVGIVAGRSFAGNAAFLGCCDVIIAAKGTTLGMGGPAMIEGAGLGIFSPEEVGPLSVMGPNGVVDVIVEDEEEAVAVAKQYLSYFQGDLVEWEAPDQRGLRQMIPENRLRSYDVHAVLEGLADTGSILELRPLYAEGMVTAFIRIAGKAVGVIANNPVHLAGAITSDGSEKSARFMQVCDAFDIPILFLCDTPGIMVGPEAEVTGLVRHSSKLFVVGANLSVPFMTVLLRKAYGLGAIAMSGASFKASDFTVAWPTGELGGMGLEGAVRLGYKKELEAVEDPTERKALYDQLVAQLYEEGKGLQSAAMFEIDDVIDPVDTRRWVLATLSGRGKPEPRTKKKHIII